MIRRNVFIFIRIYASEVWLQFLFIPLGIIDEYVCPYKIVIIIYNFIHILRYILRTKHSYKCRQ